MSEAMAIGIDVGGSKIAAAIIDNRRQILATTRMQTPQSYADFLVAVQDIVTQLGVEYVDLTGQSCPQLPVGICLPGFIDPNIGPIFIQNIPALAGQPLLEDLTDLLRRRVRLMNDAQAFLLSAAQEFLQNTRQSGPIFGAILGTGVGGGLMVNDHIVAGLQGAAGEWGQIAWPGISPDPYRPDFLAANEAGRIEEWLGLRGLIDLARQIHPGHHQPHDIAAAISGNLPWAISVRDHYAGRLAKALEMVVFMLDPAIVLLGGGVSQMPGLAEQVMVKLRPLLPTAQSKLSIHTAPDADSHSMIGAALLWLGRV